MIEPKTKKTTKKAIRRPPHRDTLDALVSFASRARFERIPERARAMAKLHIIDGVGVMLAGVATSAVRALQRRLAAESGSAEVVGAHRTASPPMAAFANTFGGRALEYDDVQTTETSIYGVLARPTVPVLASALAVGQTRNASGEALLVAYLAGVEVTARLAAATDSKALLDGSAPSATFGGIGAVFAAAKLLGLTPRRTRAALAIWESKMARDRTAAKPPPAAALRDADSVRAAVEAALLAAKGMTVDAPARSARSILSVPLATMKDIGKPYSILQPGFAIRVYPSHPLTHPALDLMLAIVNLHDLRAAAIDRIEVGITRVMAEVLELMPPTTIGGLRHNLPFAVALAACRGVVVPGDFARLPKQRVMHDMMKRIDCRVDPTLDARGHERAWTIVRVLLKSGRVIEMKTDVAKGTPQKPLSEIELFHKFFQCALPVLDGKEAERLLNRLWLLDEASHVAGLCRLDAPWPTDVESGAAGKHAHDHDHDAHGRGHHAHLGHDDPFHGHGHPTRPRRGRRRP